jgi:hypothetical protein
MPSVSEAEFVKLKKELLRARETINDLRQELEDKDKRNIKLESVSTAIPI